MLLKKIVQDLEKNRILEMYQKTKLECNPDDSAQILVDNLCRNDSKLILRTLTDSELRDGLKKIGIESSGSKESKVQRLLETIEKENSESVSFAKVAPDFDIWGNFRNYNYDYCYALSELIDNSIQSHLDSGKDIKELSIEIHFDLPTRIIVKDNAQGFHANDFERAFSPAAKASDTSNLNEFGQGMKAACSWMARKWTVRTRTPDSPKHREVVIDVDRLLKKPTDKVPVYEIDVSKLEEDDLGHGTTIIMEGLLQLKTVPNRRGVEPFVRRLAEMYTFFLNDGLNIELFTKTREYNFKDYVKKEPESLISKPLASIHKDVKEHTWRRDIDFVYKMAGVEYKVRGFCLIRGGKSSGKDTAVRIYRRGRLIEGTDREPLAPYALVGAGNMWVRKRLYVVLHLDDFPVSPNKRQINFRAMDPELDTFENDQMKDAAEEFYTWLKSRIAKFSNSGVDFFQQCKRYRVLKPKKPPESTKPKEEVEVKEVLNTKIDLENKKPDTSNDIQKEEIQIQVGKREDETEALKKNLPEDETCLINEQKNVTKTSQTQDSYIFDFEGRRICVYLIFELQLRDRLWWTCPTNEEENLLEMKLNRAHPMYTQFENHTDSQGLLSFICFIASIGCAELCPKYSSEDFRENIEYFLNHQNQ